VSQLYDSVLVPALAMAEQDRHGGLRFPRTKIIVGVWGFAGNSERALQRFQPSPPSQLVTNLADAVKFVVESGLREHTALAGAARIAELTVSGQVTFVG
jgi:hypothetical protein